MHAKDTVGAYGERVAARHLAEAGLVVLDRNWRCADGELDIVARDGSTLVFCEVKTRRSARFGSPAEAVGPVKVRRIRRLARLWIAASGLHPVEVRFDVLSVLPQRRARPPSNTCGGCSDGVRAHPVGGAGRCRGLPRRGRGAPRAGVARIGDHRAARRCPGRSAGQGARGGAQLGGVVASTADDRRAEPRLAAEARLGLRPRRRDSAARRGRGGAGRRPGRCRAARRARAGRAGAARAGRAARDGGGRAGGRHQGRGRRGERSRGEAGAGGAGHGGREPAVAARGTPRPGEPRRARARGGATVCGPGAARPGRGGRAGRRAPRDGGRGRGRPPRGPVRPARSGQDDVGRAAPRPAPAAGHRRRARGHRGALRGGRAAGHLPAHPAPAVPGAAPHREHCRAGRRWQRPGQAGRHLAREPRHPVPGRGPGVRRQGARRAAPAARAGRGGDRAVGGVARYPAAVQLVLAANPCPCATAAGDAACTCPAGVRRRYLGRLSGPLLDRIDIQVDLLPVRAAALLADVDKPESSAVVAARVEAARAAAAERWRRHGWRTNAEASVAALRGRYRLPRSITAALDAHVDRGDLSARGYIRVQRLAWTLADLAGRGSPTAGDVHEATFLRKRGAA